MKMISINPIRTMRKLMEQKRGNGEKIIKKGPNTISSSAIVVSLG